MKLVKYVGASALGAALLGMLFVAQTTPVQAADHTDPPRVGAIGNPADIGDFYAFRRVVDGVPKLVVVLTFAGPVEPVVGQGGTFADDILYNIHIDRDGSGTPNTPDVSIDVRYAQNDLGNWGVRVLNVPGAAGPIIGNVETTLSDNDVRVWTGLREDPFFFDLQGLQDTLGGTPPTLSFQNDRDFFAGKNITALAIEMPVSAVAPSDETLHLWATTAQLP